MELALSIALIVGIILFVIGLFIVVLGGFKHHFFTGIIALIPFVNIIILPSVWHRSHIGFYLGIVGALLAVGAWYGGGNQYLASEAGKFGLNLPNTQQQSVNELSGEPLPRTSGSTVQETQDTRKTEQEIAPEQANISDYKGDVKELPKQILYRLIFETVENNDTSGLNSEHVRLQQKKGKIIEGKVLESNSSSLVIEYVENNANVTLEVKADTILKLEQLVKRSN
jgi:hypothetical protein